MVLTDEQVKKFQAIYLQEFGIEIELEEAREKALKLVGLYKVLLSFKTFKNLNDS